MYVSRRTFLEAAVAGGAAVKLIFAAGVDPKTGMPLRVLGKTGCKVSCLVLGCGSRLLMYTPERTEKVLNRAINLGINYLDTAQSYGDGESERRVGRVVAKRRKEVFLTTKVSERDGDKVRRLVEESLKRLQTDHLDLTHIHSVEFAEDVQRIEAPNGLLDTLFKLREERITRFVGATSHTDPVSLADLPRRQPLDVTQMALNAALLGYVSARQQKRVDAEGVVNFETIAMPVAQRKNMGIIAMKVFAQEKLVGAAPAADLIHYLLSLPVTAVVIGMPKEEYLEANVRIVKSFRQMPMDKMKSLSDRLAAKHKASLDRLFRNHVDA